MKKMCNPNGCFCTGECRMSPEEIKIKKELQKKCDQINRENIEKMVNNIFDSWIDID